jgi:hypothetical protein
MDTTTPAVSPLRQRMIEDMRMRKLETKTQQAYIRAVLKLSAYLKRSPDTATVEDLRNFQLHLVDTGSSPITLNATLSGLKFFFDVTLDQGHLLAKMQSVHVPHTLPVVLSRDEVARLLAAAPNFKHQTALTVAYATGLRASEVISLKVGDVDSQRMTLRVEQGKGSKDRYAIAHQNKAVVYGLLFDIAAEVLLTIAGDPKHLGARIAATLVLHTWGSALTHHPHVHGIVPGGGLSADGKTWVACRPGFFLPVRVLSRLFRRRFLEELLRLHQAGKLQFFGEHAALADAKAFKAWLVPLRRCEWVVYAKRPFAGPQAVLAYLSRYTHRVAISNSRLLALDERGVTFRWKDYRVKEGATVGAGGKTRHKTMTLAPEEFMRRFLLHVLPGGFHRIRHYGLLANGSRKQALATVRCLLMPSTQGQASVKVDDVGDVAAAAISPKAPSLVCRHCGQPLTILLTLARAQSIRAPPPCAGAP